MANDPSEVQDIIVYGTIPWPSSSGGGGTPGGDGAPGSEFSEPAPISYPTYDCPHNVQLGNMQSSAQSIVNAPNGSTIEHSTLSYRDSNGDLQNTPISTMNETGQTSFDITGMSSYTQLEIMSHSHPGGTSWPSAGDYRAAQKMVDMGADASKLILLIVNPPSSINPDGLVSSYKFSDLRAPPASYADTQSINQPGWSPPLLDQFKINAVLPQC